MIISEKQIMKLLNIAKQTATHMCNLHTSYSNEILELIKIIENQQSEELKVVE